MSHGELMPKTEFFLRCLHVFASIIWAGHLYFFNFVNLPLQSCLDEAGKRAVNPHLMPRALWWFRWGAMATFVSGLILFALIYMRAPAVSLAGDRARWIMWGMSLGSVMWFNVWFIIWPAQKALLSGSVAGPAAETARLRAARTSKLNAYLSGPMLVGMLAAGHAGMRFSYGAFAVLTLLAFAAIKAADRHAAFVGRSVH